MACEICGDDETRGPLCGACDDLGFMLGARGEIICPECGEDFRGCACTQVIREGGEP